MTKAIFLDRDGTINVEKNYLYKTDDFEFLPGVLDGLNILQDAGFLLVVITNQSGIARGYYTEEQYNLLNNWMEQQLKNNGILLTASYFCPHHPNAEDETYRINCNCRKPKIGLFEEAVSVLDIDLSESFSIGDKIRDCAICHTTLCRGYLIGQNEEASIIENVKNGKIQNVQYVSTLKEAAISILEGAKRMPEWHNH